MHTLDAFLASERGAVARYRQRLRRRIRILVDDIEPQSKKMAGADRDRFQATVAEQMTAGKRGPFNGPVALKLDLATTSSNAPQAHTIAKNILDLLGRRRPAVKWRRRHLLYKDDAQIQALSVSCRHGEEHPMIGVEGRPFAAMLAMIRHVTAMPGIARTRNRGGSTIYAISVNEKSRRGSG
jgi:hypothetical protein